MKRKIWIGVFLLLLAVSPAWSQVGRNCISADIPWQMEMPDGSVHEPGQVTLCYVREYNPVSALYALKVDGMPLGIFQSTVARSEEQTSSHPILILKTDGNGHVRLVAYAWPVEDYMNICWLHEPGRNAESRTVSVPLLELQRKGEYYLIAASRSF